jgi:XTP/dITP diphosphohydrolase
MNAICFATNNKNKLKEVWHLASSDFRILSLEDIGCFEELPETQPTIEENSKQKAEYVLNKFGVRCFADDTGLEVDALLGAPGVYSARYAGDHKNSEDNINLLLKNLEEATNRQARFRTVITLVGFGASLFFEGIVEGEIINEKRGTMGFGYDPVFVPSGYDKTLAEMTLEEKNTLSHRALAIQQLVAFLKSTSSHQNF